METQTVFENYDLDFEFGEENDFARKYHERDDKQDLFEELDADADEIQKQLLEGEEKKITEEILFYIQELGSIKRLNDREVYLVTETVEKSLKDIKRKLKEENQNYPIVSFILGQQKVFQNNLVPMLTTQRENKEIVFNILIILDYLTEPLKVEMIEDFKHKEDFIKNYESYKEIFAQEEFIDLIIDELKECVRKPVSERSTFEKDIIELILYLIRNSLSFSSFTSSSENQVILLKLFELYLKQVGVFNAIIFLSQEFTEDNKHLCYLFLEIFHLVTKRVRIREIFLDGNHNDIFKKIQERQKEGNRQRRMQQSTRHSNFGALFQYNQDGQPVKLAITPNLKLSSHVFSNKNILNKIQKPKTRSHMPNKNTEMNSEQQQISLLSIKSKMQIMLIDMLEHCYDVIIQSNHQEFYSQDNISYRYDESKIFLDFLSFGVEVGLLWHYQKRKTPWLLSGLQILLIDFCFNKLTDALDQSKSQINYYFVYSSLNYLEKVLKAIIMMAEHESEQQKQNSEVLQKVLFTKEFSKLMKKCFNIFRRLPRNPINKLIIKVVDYFFQTLSINSKNKIYQIKSLLGRDYVPDEENEALELHHQIAYKEKKFTYLTELGIFLDFDIINIHVEYLKDQEFYQRPYDFKQAIYSFLNRIINDLNAKWMFYQVDFLSIFNDFYTFDDIYHIKDETVKQIKKVIEIVFEGVKETMKINSLLIVEILFRFPNFSIKENILSNYQGIRPNLKEEQIYIEIDKSSSHQNPVKPPKEDDSFINDDEEEKVIEKEENEMPKNYEQVYQNMNTKQILDKGRKKTLEEEIKDTDYQRLIFKDQGDKRTMKIQKRLIKKKLTCKEQVKNFVQQDTLKQNKNHQSKFQLEKGDHQIIMKDDSSDDSVSVEISLESDEEEKMEVEKEEEVFEKIQKSEDEDEPVVRRKGFII